MQRLRFPIAVALTSFGVVTLLVLAGAVLVGGGLARATGWAYGAPVHGGPPWLRGAGEWSGIAVPPQIAGLADIPHEERFSHFKGAQVTLSDKDGQPLVLAITAGTAAAVSATSVTINANDGSQRTFAIDGQTIVRGPRARDGDTTLIAQGERVVAVSINNSGTAAAVFAGSPGGDWRGHAPFGHRPGARPWE